MSMLIDSLPDAAADLLAAVRGFAQATVAPLAAQPSAAQCWAGPAIRAACAQGLAGIEVPKDQGGHGLPYAARTAVAEALYVSSRQPARAARERPVDGLGG